MTTLHTPSPVAKTSLVLATAGTVAALVVVASIGGWRATHNVATPQAIEHGGVAPPDTLPPAVSTEQGLTIYLVGTDEERMLVRTVLGQTGAGRGHDATLSSIVITAPTHGGEQFARALAGDASLMRVDSQPSMTLVDLRHRQAGVPGQAD